MKEKESKADKPAKKSKAKSKKKFLTHHEHVKQRGDLRQNWQVKREKLEATYGSYGISCLQLAPDA